MRMLLYLENNCFNRDSYVTVNSHNETDSDASSMKTLWSLFSTRHKDFDEAERSIGSKAYNNKAYC